MKILGFGVAIDPVTFVLAKTGVPSSLVTIPGQSPQPYITHRFSVTI